MESGVLPRNLLRWLWPQTCAHCREDLPPEDDQALCAACRPALAPCEPPFCLRCAEPSRGRAHCSRCASRLFSCRLIRAAVRYRGPAVSIVHAFKFRGRRDAARAAGAAMAARLAAFPELGRPDLLVPMPLHPRRRRERGYDQARLIADALAAASGIPVAELAVRERHTRPLWPLERDERAAELRRAFAGRPGAEGRRLLIVDDVCTTGASLEACARALREAGAAETMGYVFARQGG